MPILSISVVVSAADITAIETSAGDIKLKLPFLINLTPQERKKFRKKGTKREGYVKDVYEGIVANPTVVPVTFSIPEYTKDYNLDTVLLHIRSVLSSIIEGIDDTRMMVGVELMKQSDTGYDYLKRAAKDNAALQSVVDKIAKAFAGQGKKKTPPKP